MSRQNSQLSDERIAEIRRLGYQQEQYVAGEMTAPDALDIDCALRDLLNENDRMATEIAVLEEHLEISAAEAKGLQWEIGRLKRMYGIREKPSEPPKKPSELLAE